MRGVPLSARLAEVEDSQSAVHFAEPEAASVARERNRRPWTVRQVTSTRAPPSGMKRSCDSCPRRVGKRKAILLLALKLSSGSPSAVPPSPAHPFT
jgi:hypothetical protein